MSYLDWKEYLCLRDKVNYLVFFQMRVRVCAGVCCTVKQETHLIIIL
jgi:hypothetical protein